MCCVAIAATSLMFKHLKIEAIDTFIHTSWTSPRFLPYAYTQVVVCSLLCDIRRISYIDNTLTKVRTDLSSNLIVTKDIRANSRCKVTFKAIYNPASRDPGIVKQLVTPIQSKYNNKLTNYSPPCILMKIFELKLFTDMKFQQSQAE